MWTQNVDRLHHKADSRNVVELHGTTHRHAQQPPIPASRQVAVSNKKNLEKKKKKNFTKYTVELR
jgi:NAD-dependent SIR2 family protein deacetylase